MADKKGDIEATVRASETLVHCRLCGARETYAPTPDGIGTAMAWVRRHADDHLEGRIR